jgi:hypothetical protein
VESSIYKYTRTVLFVLLAMGESARSGVECNQRIVHEAVAQRITRFTFETGQPKEKLRYRSVCTKAAAFSLLIVHHDDFANSMWR